MVGFDGAARGRNADAGVGAGRLGGAHYDGVHFAEAELLCPAHLGRGRDASNAGSIQSARAFLQLAAVQAARGQGAGARGGGGGAKGRLLRRLVLGQRQPNAAEVCHAVLEYEGKRVFKHNLNDAGQAGASREQREVFQVIDALDDGVVLLRRLINLDGLVFIGTDDRLLRAEVAGTGEVDLRLYLADLNGIGEVVHIPNNFLKISGRHRNHGLKIRRWNVDVDDVDVKHREFIGRAQVLLGVLNANAEVVGVVAVNEKRQHIAVANGLNQHMQFQHINANVELTLATVGLKAVCFQFEVDEDDVGVVQGDDLHTGLVKFQVHIHQYLFEGIYDLLEGGCLHGFDFQERHFDEQREGVEKAIIIRIGRC